MRNHANAIAAIDLCLVHTVTFERLFALIIMGHGRRQLIWFAVTRHPTADWLAQQIVEAFPWDTARVYLVRDNDCSYGHAFMNRLRSMGIRDRPTAPRSPCQNAYVERLIGTLRRECLDHVLIFGEWHLRQVLKSYSLYYNEMRTHLSLDKDAPLPRPAQRFGTIVSVPILSGLHHCYARHNFWETHAVLTPPALSHLSNGPAIVRLPRPARRRSSTLTDPLQSRCLDQVLRIDRSTDRRSPREPPSRASSRRSRPVWSTHLRQGRAPPW